MKEKEEVPQIGHIVTTIEIAKKLENENKFSIIPHRNGVVFKFGEEGILSIDDMEQDIEIFRINIKHVQHIAYHILTNTEQDIKNKYSNDIIDVVRNKFIDENFREKFFIGLTSKSFLFVDLDQDISNKVFSSGIIINPPISCITIMFHLIESLTGEKKRVPIDMDINTFRSLVKEINKMNDKLENNLK